MVLSDGRPVAELTADRVEKACRRRQVEPLRLLNRRGEPGRVAAELALTLTNSTPPSPA
ncbi:MAG: hypothetical protein ACRDK5_00920 [Solirubrobacterales bacterium]